ncbi:MAG: hypothetical protein U5K71_12120 [Gracilimonas sp.]|nr:hypothetical protein [Gracilimonas sp.]
MADELYGAMLDFDNTTEELLLQMYLMSGRKWK